MISMLLLVSDGVFVEIVPQTSVVLCQTSLSLICMTLCHAFVLESCHCVDCRDKSNLTFDLTFGSTQIHGLKDHGILVLFCYYLVALRSVIT